MMAIAADFCKITDTMCYMVYISTNCPDDLATAPTDAVRFERPAAENQTYFPDIFEGQNVWYVGSSSGCSCTFRHLCEPSLELGFDVPLEWYPEGPEEIKATGELYEILHDMVLRGFQISLLDCWSGDEGKHAPAIEVSLSKVSREQFRMFEGRLFHIKP